GAPGGAGRRADRGAGRGGDPRPPLLGLTAAAVSRASGAEREGVVRDVVRLCEIESPSRRERAMADAVAAELRAVGHEVEEDASGSETGSDSGNLRSEEHTSELQ